jgi:hypothetical protein
VSSRLLAARSPSYRPLPNRKRYGLAVFRRFFEATVEQCHEAGLVWGKELYFDATQVRRACFRWQIQARQVTGDTTYGTAENIVAVEDQGIRAYVPLPNFDVRSSAGLSK